MAPRLLGLLVALALRCAGVAAFHAPPLARRAPQRHTRLLAANNPDDDGEALVLGEADAAATLGLVTALWGSQHAVAKWALGFDGGGAPALTALRFAVAAAALSPFLPRDAATWRDGLELGAWGFLGFACQTVGLETTTACRSAFLLYLNVKLVPVFELARGRTLPEGTWASAALAVAGTALLAADADGLESAWVVGDTWSVAAAAASAGFIVRLDACARRAPSAAALSAASAASTCALAGAWFLRGFDGGDVAVSGEFFLAAVYLGLVPSAPVWKPNLQPDFNVSVIERFGPDFFAVLRELDKSNRSVQRSAKSTSI
jgi:hypothetical protein